MNRRGFLAFLGAAPVAAPAVAQEIVEAAAPDPMRYAMGGVVRELKPMTLRFDASRMEKSIAARIKELHGALNNITPPPPIRAKRQKMRGLPEHVSRGKRPRRKCECCS